MIDGFLRGGALSSFLWLRCGRVVRRDKKEFGLKRDTEMLLVKSSRIVRYRSGLDRDSFRALNSQKISNLSLNLSPLMLASVLMLLLSLIVPVDNWPLPTRRKSQGEAKWKMEKKPLKWLIFGHFKSILSPF